jgi:hypothetical protein
MELALMLFGVLCACVAVVAKTRSSDAHPGESKQLVWGVTVCVISCFAGSADLVLVGMMGATLSLNEFDTVVYTSLPATALLIAAMSIPHAVQWGEDGDTLTDWEIIDEVLDNNRSVLVLAALSGVFALAFNLLKYGIVQRLSATHTAFAGNFNKAFTILLTMVVGLEPYPTDGWGWLMVAAYVGNIGAFTAYNIAKIRLQPAQDAQGSPREAEKGTPSVGSTEDDTEDKLTRLTSEEDEWQCSASADAGSYSGLDQASVPLAARDLQQVPHRGSS